MARIRTVKPEAWTDSKMVRLTPHARLLFIGSWNFADDFGCLDPDPIQLKLQVLPADDVDADALIAELFDAGMLEVLESPDGEIFWHVTNWNRHQRVSRPSDSRFGAPDEWKRPRKPVTRGFTEDSPKDIAPSTLNGKEGKGKEGKGKDLAVQERSRNEVWDALVAIFGEPTTDSNRKLRGKVVASLRRAGADHDEVIRRARTWPLHFPEAELTETALEKHWDRLGRPPLKANEEQVEMADMQARWDREEARARELDAQRRGIGDGR